MPGYARLVLAVVACLTMLAACDSRDPYKRDDVWYPSGSNAANLAAQVADPADLAGGRGDPRAYSPAQLKAVNRISTDTPRSLIGGSTVAGTGGGAEAPPPAAPPGGS